MKVSISKLKEAAQQAIKNYGYTDQEAKTILSVLMYAQLRGNNQGVVKLIGAGIPKREGNQPPKTVKETPVSVLVDGQKTHAIVVMDHLTDLAIQKAQDSHIGIAGNFNTDESTGALGYYTSKIAKEGLIGIAFASSPYSTTAPYGSNQPMYCTNPLSFAFPTKKDPIILDMSTSAMAWYGLVEAKTAGKKVPEGTGYDPDGKETTDPAAIMAGALNTIAGHKGSGLALVVQILAGVFVGADSFDRDSQNAGNLVMALDPEIFMSLDDFKQQVAALTKKVKQARKAEGFDQILMPGERGNTMTQEVYKAGEIEIEENLWQELQKVAGK